jgi:hypothetical protein
MKLYWRYKKDGKWTWKPALFEDVLAALREMEDEEK